MVKRLMSGLVLAAGVCMSNASAAAVLVNYSFSANTSATVVAPEVQTSFDASHLANHTVASDGFGVVLQAYAKNGSTTAAGALATDSYFEIHVQANAGQSLNLDALSFEVGKGGPTDPRGFFVRSSIDGFSTDLLLETLPGGAAAAPALRTIDLSLLSAFQGLDDIDLRFFAWMPDPTSQRVASVDFRNVSLSGTAVAVVPEPGSLLLAGLALAGLALVRRQR